MKSFLQNNAGAIIGLVCPFLVVFLLFGASTGQNFRLALTLSLALAGILAPLGGTVDGLNNRKP